MTPEIPKTYDPKSVESHWADFWIREKLFDPRPGKKGETFTIVIPPPNVTGSLHMGHALNNTLQDILIRWKRMQGYESLWVVGTDHGGIATQNVVEKLLKQEKVTRHDLGREKFLERMWKWRQETGDTILMQLRRLGCSLDTDKSRFTMDEKRSRAVQYAFLELFKKGWIYRGQRMVNWCVRCHTALSDIEVEYEERKDKLYHIRYPILSGKNDGWQGVPLIVATTRPETLLGDTAVAVHPDDPRYEKIHGWWVQLPLVDRNIEVIADSAVDPKFGTGVVKVTPAHDPADFDMGERHHLAREVVIGFDGKMTKEAGKYAGLSREEARKQILEDLKSQDLMEKIEDYTHSVGTCYRCGTVVEPLVSDQWFLNTDQMAAKALEASEKGLVKIHPDTWEGPYENWLKNLKHWCISRQIWWGHRIPVWYCVKGPAKGEGPEAHPAARTECPAIASGEKPASCGKCGGKELEQDPDVLDTWFSSGLWPFSVFDWPEKTPDLMKYYPTSTLVTGHEILYLWVARMVMFGLTFDPKGSGKMEEAIPYSDVFIHGIVRDKQGKKMSKSLGNVIDPLTMMDKFGTDALRFVLASQSVPGRDMQISEDTFVGARNFANKIWNVSRFVLMNMAQAREQGLEVKPGGMPSELELCDRWILTRFQKTAQAVTQALEEYNLAQAARVLYQFVWSEFCDWYVELSKIRVLEKEPTQGKRIALGVLDYVLDGVLRLAHPIMPFITEEVWKNLQSIAQPEGFPESLLLTDYPEPDPRLVQEGTEAAMGILMAVITEIRTIRSEMNVPPGEKIALKLNVHDKETEQLVWPHSSYIQHLCKSENLQIGSGLSKPGKSAASVVGKVEIFVPLEGLIDFGKERQRLEKELTAARTEIEHLTKRLSFPDFKTHAPKEEVRRTEQRKAEAEQRFKRIEEHIASIQ